MKELKPSSSLKKYLITTGATLLLPLVAQADEQDLYDFLWLDPDKAVYVLQNKVYKKHGTFYGNIGYIMGQTSGYQDTKGFQVNAGYFFNEEWAFELMYNAYNNSNNEAYENLQLINGSVPFIRRVEKSYGALAVWSPFYGKINTFNKIFYFDWSFGAGLGKVDAESNADTVADPNTSSTFSTESYTAAVLKTNFRFHVTKNFHVEAQYLRQIYKAPGPTVNNVKGKEKLRHNSDLVFSVGFSF